MRHILRYAKGNCPAGPRFSPLLVVLACALLPAGCGTTTLNTTSPDLSPMGVDDSSLVGTEWVLTEIGGQHPLGRAEITLVVDESRAGGFSGCNHYGGEPVVTAGTFRLHEIVATTMACEDSRLMDQETHYLALLAETSDYEIEGEALVLRTPSEETLVYRSVGD